MRGENKMENGKLQLTDTHTGFYDMVEGLKRDVTPRSLQETTILTSPGTPETVDYASSKQPTVYVGKDGARIRRFDG